MVFGIRCDVFADLLGFEGGIVHFTARSYLLIVINIIPQNSYPTAHKFRHFILKFRKNIS